MRIRFRLPGRGRVGFAPRRRRLAAAALAIVLTGGVAIWSYSHEQAVHAAPAVQNAALTDVAATAAVKGQITRAVQTLFSFDYSNPDKTASAISAYLTGSAVSQYATLMAPVKAHAADLKLELTTTVTSAGVQTLRGGRARVLVFVDQDDTSSANAGTSESAVAFAVDAERVGGTWRIAGIDTLGA